jgi:hypothetical protein
MAYVDHQSSRTNAEPIAPARRRRERHETCAAATPLERAPPECANDLQRPRLSQALSFRVGRVRPAVVASAPRASPHPASAACSRRPCSSVPPRHHRRHSAGVLSSVRIASDRIDMGPGRGHEASSPCATGSRVRLSGVTAMPFGKAMPPATWRAAPSGVTSATKPGANSSPATKSNSDHGRTAAERAAGNWTDPAGGQLLWAS